MRNMIPLKEAINIFEQHKISLMRDKNPHIFHTSSFGGSTGFSSYDYIISKTSEWLEIEDIPQIIPFSMGKGLLDYVSKDISKYEWFEIEDISKEYKGGTDFVYEFTEGLLLYGKDVIYNNYNEVLYISNEYTYTRRHFYIDKSSKYKPCIETGIGYLEDLDYLIFENYNYNEIYNPTINYTVQGNKESNIIKYIDISIDENELKTFLESDVFSKKLPKHIVLINEAIDKYLDKVNKVFRETIEKETKKDPEYIPLMDHFTKRIIEIKADTLDEFLDKHIELQEKYNKTL